MVFRFEQWNAHRIAKNGRPSSNYCLLSARLNRRRKLRLRKCMSTSYLAGSMVKFAVLLMPITMFIFPFFVRFAFDLLGHSKAKRGARTIHKACVARRANTTQSFTVSNMRT